MSFRGPQALSDIREGVEHDHSALETVTTRRVTTLAEDVENPRRSILLATVLVCLFTGISPSLVIYLGQRVWPNYETFPNIADLLHGCHATRARATPLSGNGGSARCGVTGSGLAAQAGATRLLFGFGRDNVLPRKIFA